MTIAVVGQKSPLSKRFIAAGRERGVELFVTGDYGINSVPDLGIFNRYHNGVDYGLIQESRLVAPFDCEVVARFDNHANFGGSLFMYSATHNVTVLYSHMSKISVRVGDKLIDGSLVGLSGGAKGSYGAGTSNGPHLHAGIANGRVTKLDKGNLNDGLWFSIETFDFNKETVVFELDRIANEVIAFGSSAVINRVKELESAKPIEPQPPVSNDWDKTGQYYAIRTAEAIKTMKEVPLFMRDGTQYGRGIEVAQVNGKDKRYLILETLRDGFYKARVTGANNGTNDPELVYLKWFPGIGFDKV